MGEFRIRISRGNQSMEGMNNIIEADAINKTIPLQDSEIDSTNISQWSSGGWNGSGQGQVFHSFRFIQAFRFK